jgi:hypothetical protein
MRLHDMAGAARKYVTSFSCCLPIKVTYFADGFGGTVALFLFEFEGKLGGTDDCLWVVAGDLPSAYWRTPPPQPCAGGGGGGSVGSIRVQPVPESDRKTPFSGNDAQ